MSFPSKTPPLIVLGVLATALALGACKQQEDPAQTQRDVIEAQREGAERIGEAQQDAAENLAEGDSAAGELQRVDEAQARTDYEVAKQRCDALPPEQQGACKQAAEDAYTRALDQAMTERRQMEQGAPATPSP